MRKALFILAIAAISLTSCNKENPNDLQEQKEASITNVVFNITANHPDGTTKAVKTGWENGDVIFVFFNNIAAPKYLKMSYDGSDWNYTQMNGASEESLGLVENATGTMRAVFLPFAGDADISADGTSFVFSKTTYSYYLTATLDYTVSGGEVSGTFNMQIPAGYIQFFLDDASASPSTEIELREPHLTPQGIASIAADGAITHTSIASGAPLPGYVYDKVNKTGSDALGYLFSGVLSAGAQNTSTNYLFTLVRGGWEGAYYKKEFTGKTWYRGESEGRALKMPAIGNWISIVDYKPIDLGINVNGKRIYWSNCNIGATLPKDYGEYLAWGETEPKSFYAWGTYKWCNGNNTSFTKYNNNKSIGSVDYKKQLETGPDGDDVASKRLGGNWRMPTKDEWSKILADCTWTWESLDGTNGKKGTSNLPGYTDRWVFFSAAGGKDNNGFFQVGEVGDYWSSDLFIDNPVGAYGALFSASSASLLLEHRFIGHPVRPVSE